jgi:hypothetical protein
MKLFGRINKVKLKTRKKKPISNERNGLFKVGSQVYLEITLNAALLFFDAAL